jgi:hypothetical protein
MTLQLISSNFLNIRRISVIFFTSLGAEEANVCSNFFVRRGIRVIVGHYKGDQSPSPNFTWAELNQNRNNHVSFYINYDVKGAQA